MLTELCRELKNWFIKSDDDIHHEDEYVISNGVITPSISLQDGQYYRIVGSLYNDGVHRNDVNDVLVDETFEGSVWCMYVPREIEELAKEIEEWQSKYAESVNSPYTSESFGGYSYTKKSNSSSNGDSTVTWKDIFASKLNRWRKI